MKKTPLLMGLFEKFFHLHDPQNPLYQNFFYFVIPLKGPGSNGINNALTIHFYKKIFLNPNVSIFRNHGSIYTLRILVLMTIRSITSNNALAMKTFLSITLSEFPPEDFTKVTFFGKLCMIYCHIFINIPFMVLEPIAIFHTRLPYPTFGHILYISKTGGNTAHQEINATYLPVY